MLFFRHWVIALSILTMPTLASSDYNYSQYFRYGSQRPAPLISLDLNPQHLINASFRIAAREDRLSDMEHLFEQGAKVNSESDEGETALMYASRNCSLRIVSALIHDGAGTNLRDHEGQTALIHATIESCLPVVRLFLKLPGIRVTPRDHAGRNALDYAIDNASMEVDGPAAQILWLFERQERVQEARQDRGAELQAHRRSMEMKDGRNHGELGTTK